MELLAKQLEGADKQLIECKQQIESMAEEKELKNKELEELSARQVVVHMVDHLEEGVVDGRPLSDHLREAP